MKVLLYFEGQNAISTSGIGRALKHQMKALETVGVDYTLDPYDDYDVLHINTYFLNSKFVINKARKMNKAVIYHAHSTEEDFRNSFVFSNQLSPLYKKHLISLYSKADELITPTPYSKNILQSYGINVPINVISNGINLERYKYNEEKVKAFLKYFNLKNDDIVIMGVGLLFERKGIIDFIEVAKRFPSYKFIWFGDTPSISITRNVKEAISKRPINVIMPGYVKGPIIEGAYLFSKCFLFPSYEETEGIVVLEALASKCLTIVRNIGVFDPWLKDNENVLMGKDVNDFEEKIKYAILNDLNKIKEEGYKTASDRCIENIGKQLKEVYERVYQGKRK